MVRRKPGRKKVIQLVHRNGDIRRISRPTAALIFLLSLIIIIYIKMSLVIMGVTPVATAKKFVHDPELLMNSQASITKKVPFRTNHHKLGSGNMIHRSFSKNITKDFIAKDLPQQLMQAHNDNNVTIEEAAVGKETLLHLLHRAGIEQFDLATLQLLPTWNDVVKLYGSQSKLVGLETCSQFQSTVLPQDRFLAPAGFFNTGTNLLYTMLMNNCKGKNTTTMLTHFQVPWGKHVPASQRSKYRIPKEIYQSIPTENVLPIVMIRDPYTFFASLCRHQYSVHWPHADISCPNVWEGRPVRAKLGNRSYEWTSLIHLWNQWNSEYYDYGEKSRLMVRMEDLLFHPKPVVKQICHCAGGSLTEPFYYEVDSVKDGFDKKTSSMVSAMIRYGSSSQRIEPYGSEELQYIAATLNRTLLSDFGYSLAF